MANSNKMISGLLIGAAVGLVGGLLLASRPGKESRRVVAIQAGEFREKATVYLNTMRRKMRGGDGGEVLAGVTDRQLGTHE